MCVSTSTVDRRNHVERETSDDDLALRQRGPDTVESKAHIIFIAVDDQYSPDQYRLSPQQIEENNKNTMTASKTTMRHHVPRRRFAAWCCWRLFMAAALLFGGGNFRHRAATAIVSSFYNAQDEKSLKLCSVSGGLHIARLASAGIRNFFRGNWNPESGG